MSAHMKSIGWNGRISCSISIRSQNEGKFGVVSSSWSVPRCRGSVSEASNWGLVTWIHPKPTSRESMRKSSSDLSQARITWHRCLTQECQTTNANKTPGECNTGSNTAEAGKRKVMYCCCCNGIVPFQWDPIHHLLKAPTLLPYQPPSASGASPCESPTGLNSLVATL